MQGQKATYELSSNGFDCPDKCLLISQLKAKLYQLEENDKAYDDLYCKYKQLQNDHQLMNEAKLRLEYELKQKNEATNKILNDLKAQNCELNNQLNDKNSTNQKLFTDNHNLFRNLEDRNKENETFSKMVCDNEDLIDHINQDKAQCEHDLCCLNDATNQNKCSIQNLSCQLDSLTLKTKNQNDALNAKNLEVCNNQKMLDGVKCDNIDLTNKINLKTNSLNSVQKQLCLANKNIADLQNDLNNLQKDNCRNLGQLDNLKNDFQNERALRCQAEQENARLDDILKDKTDTLKQLSIINDSLKASRENLTQNNDQLKDEIERYKRHVMILTDQTTKLQKELENIVGEDTEMQKNNCNQIFHLRQAVCENKKQLEDEINQLNYLDNLVKRTTSPCRCKSPCRQFYQ